MTPPSILRSWAQPTTKTSRKAEVKAKQTVQEAGLPPRAIPTVQEIGFFGHTPKGEAKTFSVLAGEGAPTVTGGWPKVAKVPRFQRVAITVPEGYEPIEMTVPVLFDAVVKTKDREHVEAEILVLEWMAGRTPNPAGGEIKGEPPYVEVYTTDAAGRQTNLVPKPYQTVPGRSQQWYITDLAFDANPIRSFGGERIRQAVTVTLLEIVSSPSLLKRNRESREEVKGKFKTFKTTSAIDTIRKVALHYGVPGAWKAILEANKKLGGNAERKLPEHTAVRVPETIFRQVPK